MPPKCQIWRWSHLIKSENELNEKEVYQEQSRVATIDDLKTLIKSLNENQVDYFLIGGYALFAHGYERATMDIDIIVPATIDTGHKVKKALMVLPDKVALDIDPGWFVPSNSEDFGNIRVADEITVNVMFNACEQTYETLKESAQTVELNGIELKTIDLEGLIKTKQTVRPKDQSDCQILRLALEKIQEQKQKRSSRP